MSATKITAAFERWHQIWTCRFPTDEAGEAAAEERRALEGRIISARACSTADVLAKVRMLCEHARGGMWGKTDEMLASIAADLEQLAKGGAS